MCKAPVPCGDRRTTLWSYFSPSRYSVSGHPTPCIPLTPQVPLPAELSCPPDCSVLLVCSGSFHCIDLTSWKGSWREDSLATCLQFRAIIFISPGDKSGSRAYTRWEPGGAALGFPRRQLQYQYDHSQNQDVNHEKTVFPNSAVGKNFSPSTPPRSLSIINFEMLPCTFARFSSYTPRSQRMNKIFVI